MNAVCRAIRYRLSMLAISFALVSLFLYASQPMIALADESSVTIVQVEEDWELIVDVPDSNSIAPQVTCTISPTNTVNSLHATFDLNHHSQPDFIAGGLQLQTWNEEWPLTSHNDPQQHVMASNSEVVIWTQSMAISDGLVLFEIINGTSTTWGSFGGQGYLRSAVSTSLADLSGYTPDTSVQNSGIAYASNRVTSLKLLRIRVTTSTGEVFEDSTPRIVHQKN